MEKVYEAILRPMIVMTSSAVVLIGAGIGLMFCW